MARVEIAFLLSDMLYWSTYRQNLLEAVAQRDDILPLVRTYTLPRWLKPLCKQNYARKLNKLPRLDPMVVADWRLRPWWQRTRARHEVRAALVVTHTLALPLATTAREIPFIPLLDYTRAASLREFAGPGWTQTDVAREKECLARAHHILVTNQWSLDSLRSEYGLSHEQASLLPLSASVHHAQQRGQRTWSRPRVLFVGNSLQRKGFDRLLAWLDGPLQGLCELHVVSREPVTQIRPGLVVHGRVPNQRLLSELMPNMDVLCLPTREDMAAGVVIEAGMCALPSVASRVGGIPELIESGETGYLVDKDDDEGFINALKLLLEDVELNQRMGENAFKRARRLYSSSAHFQNVLDRLVAAASS